MLQAADNVNQGSMLQAADFVKQDSFSPGGGEGEDEGALFLNRGCCKSEGGRTFLKGG